ncbi:acyl-CoA dehydrogenase domain-containing protein [Marinicella litoralis]|uniref:medium-chain acyl-CoA dehydrogenase n=1 Tax=Marinicella litoralis TaxID=644220 RepID=A0A4R6XF40_9GAMM|nr:acyl-CoA dehydrogenase domain-containing protein [Marinicella litoralis]TDR16849.1 alkylation response protein AidB-like acyl-CoA dehydrogenase [Marinicella litoralis]
MTLYIITLFLLALIHAFYLWPFWLLSVFWFITPFVFYKLQFITNTQGIITLFLLLNVIIIGNFRYIRMLFITLPVLRIFNNKDRINWQRFTQIDDGWLVTDFEKSIYNGKPDFKFTPIEILPISDDIKKFAQSLISGDQRNMVEWRKSITPEKYTGLTIEAQYGGHAFHRQEVAYILSTVAQVDPLLGALIGIVNTESVISIIQKHGTSDQKRNYLPAFVSGEKLPFLNATFLYELLENGKSSIEGRIDIESHQDQSIHGIRLSFTDIIMLGTPKSSVFYLAVNLSDFANELSERTKLGTVLCILDAQTDKIEIRQGNVAYKGLFNYYSCSAQDIFIPLSQIVGGFNCLDQGIKQMYEKQAMAASLWPAAVSRPIHDSTTYISWFFAHIKKQNSRALLNYKLVQKQLNRQFSHRQRLINIQQMALINGDQSLMSYTNILFKNSIFDISLHQLTWLRTVLGSNAHQIKSENNLNQYFRVKHLSMELDGNSHEINQLPLMKKVALSAHPWYSKEVEVLNKPQVDIKKLDFLIFKHIAFIWHNCAKVWVYSFRTSWLGRFIWRKSKHQNLIRRMSSTYALIADLALIKWSLKEENNTEFTGYLAQCNQQLLMQMAVLRQYITNNNDDNTKFFLKQSMRDSFYLSQKSMNQCINSAFSRFTALTLKVLVFPFGKPFHQASFATKHNETMVDSAVVKDLSRNNSILARISKASEQLSLVKNIENAVSNATGFSVTTKNYQVLIDRTLAAGIISVEQAEQIRTAYDSIHELELINHFGNHNEN